MKTLLFTIIETMLIAIIVTAAMNAKVSNPNTKGKEYRQILILQGLSNRLRKQWYEQYYTKGMGFTPKYQITFKNDIKYEEYSTSKEYQDVYSFLSQNDIDYKNKKLSYLNSIIER